MLDHIGIEVSDYHRSKKFYQQALQPLGINLLIEVQGFAGFGSTLVVGPIAGFWMHEGLNPSKGVHIAFQAKSRADVDAFYDAAIAAGGQNNGAPGLRPIYHENYYGAFVWDPDGYNIEAVCHDPE